MAGLSWTPAASLLILALQLSASGQRWFLTARDGGDATLPCGRLAEAQPSCGGATWAFVDSTNVAVALPGDGAGEDARRSVTPACGLRVQNVTAEDVGLYVCRQVDPSWRQRGRLAVVHLSVVTLAERRRGGEATLSCSVRTRTWCPHAVEWQLQGHGPLASQATEGLCNHTVTVATSRLSQDFYERLKCSVTNVATGTVQTFPFRRSPQTPRAGPLSLLRSVLVCVALAALAVSAAAANVWARSRATGDAWNPSDSAAPLHSAPAFVGRRIRTEADAVGADGDAAEASASV